jgi:hypothetical protein
MDNEGAKRLMIGMLAVAGSDMIAKPRKKREDEITRRSNLRSAKAFIKSEFFEEICDALHVRADIIRKAPELLATIDTRVPA